MTKAATVAKKPKKPAAAKAKGAVDQDLQVAEGEVTVGQSFADKPKMTMRNINVYYSDKQAIYDVNIDIAQNEVIAMIGPSGCGKSTFLRTLNRMNDTVEGCRIEGDICMDGENLYSPKLDAYFHLGKLIEVNPTEKEFTMPEHKLTEAYITGRFG